MFCTNCGNKLDQVKNFCPNCGEKIAVASNPDVALPQVNIDNSLNNLPKTKFEIELEEKRRKQKIKKGLKLLVLIVFIPFVLLSAFSGRFVLFARVINWYNKDE